MSLTSQIVAVNGRPTEILTAGEGDPLVFLHGGGIVEGFEPLIPLAERFRLVVPFMPGFSETASEPAINSRDEMVAHIAALFDELGIERTVLVGHSLGGWLASATTAAHGEKISKLVLACPYGMNVEAHPMPPLGGTFQDEMLALTNDQSVWEGRVPDGPDAEFDAAREREGESIGRFMPGPFDPDLESLLAAITQPTLILWGDDDKIVPTGHASAWEAAIADAELRMFPGAGHLIFHERPDAVEAVGEFAGS